ncbi:hypothetical protein HDU96_002394 [Phlyctochytrium bullatum]|nr:hypothetical protein HDU96_002394 [Phlyctochytrium bullatum]
MRLRSHNRTRPAEPRPSYIEHVPLEIARTITLHLKPWDLHRLLRCSRKLRTLFAPKPSEILFARRHLRLRSIDRLLHVKPLLERPYRSRWVSALVKQPLRLLPEAYALAVMACGHVALSERVEALAPDGFWRKECVEPTLDRRWMAGIVVKAMEMGLVDVRAETGIVRLAVWLDSAEVLDVFMRKLKKGSGKKKGARAPKALSTDDEDTPRTLVNTALWVACQYGTGTFVEHILEAFRDLVDVASEDTRDPYKLFYSAIHRKHLDVTRALLRFGFPIDHGIDSSGFTWLHYAVTKGFGEGLEAIRAYIAENSADPEWEAPDVDAKDRFGLTPLMYAIHREDRHAVAVLLSMGANVLARNRYGRAAVDYALRSFNPEIVKLVMRPLAEMRREGRLSNALSSGEEDEDWYDVEEAFKRFMLLKQKAVREVMHGFEEFREEREAAVAAVAAYDLDMHCFFQATLKWLDSERKWVLNKKKEDDDRKSYLSSDGEPEWEGFWEDPVSTDSDVMDRDDDDDSDESDGW